MQPTETKDERAALEREQWAAAGIDERLAELLAWIKAGMPDEQRARIHALTRPLDDNSVHLWLCGPNGYVAAVALPVGAVRPTRIALYNPSEKVSFTPDPASPDRYVQVP